MQTTFLAVRAIGAEFARGLWLTALIGAAVTGGLLIVLLLWLTSLSSWWWLLAIPIGIALSVAAVLLVVVHLLINYVRPRQSKAQAALVKAFVGKLQFASEITSTPKFIMLFRVVRSIAAPKSDRYLQELLETKDLKHDFTAITKTFQ